MTVTDVLRNAWKNAFTTRCDFARQNAELIAMAASDGFITTRQAAGLYGRQWLITSRGLRHLRALGAEQ